jgi:hypothetical protein
MRGTAADLPLNTLGGPSACHDLRACRTFVIALLRAPARAVLQARRMQARGGICASRVRHRPRRSRQHRSGHTGERPQSLRPCRSRASTYFTTSNVSVRPSGNPDTVEVDMNDSTSQTRNIHDSLMLVLACQGERRTPQACPPLHPRRASRRRGSPGLRGREFSWQTSIHRLSVLRRFSRRPSSAIPTSSRRDRSIPGDALSIAMRCQMAGLHRNAATRFAPTI